MFRLLRFEHCPLQRSISFQLHQKQMV